MKNTKYEIRNTKQARNSNDRNSKRSRVRYLEHSDFYIRICFGFRISDFGFLLIGVFTAFVLLHDSTNAQDPPTAGECMADVYRLASHEQRIYRDVLFGKKEAEDERIGTVRYSKGGDAWMKTEDDEWKSLAPGFESTTWTDAIWSSQDESDRVTDISVRRGLFEMKQLLTSELVPSVTQSIRALQCRMRSICLVVSDSMQKDAPAMIQAQPPGCLELTYPRFEGCVYDQRNPTQAVETEVRRECESATRALLVREMDLAKLVVSYDAGFRTLLQFMGVFEQYLTEFRFPLIQPLEEAVQLIGSLHRIPCFISECNE